MNVQIEESWKTHLQPEFEKDYFRTLTEFVKSEYSQYQIFSGKTYFQRLQPLSFRQGEGSNHRTRPVPRTGPGTRSVSL